jgi:hypothetical protein
MSLPVDAVPPVVAAGVLALARGGVVSARGADADCVLLDGALLVVD